MNHEVGAVTEGFPAFCTLVRLLSCVDSLVHSEVGTLTEGFSTLRTHVLSPFTVTSLLGCGGTELLATVFTLLVTPFSGRLAIFKCLMFELSRLSPHPLQLGASQWPFSSYRFLLNLLRPLQLLCGILLGVTQDSDV